MKNTFFVKFPECTEANGANRWLQHKLSCLTEKTHMNNQQSYTPALCPATAEASNDLMACEVYSFDMS